MKNLLLFVPIFIVGIAIGQREINANKIESKIILDGVFDESSWNSADWTSNFTQMRPVPGAKPSKKTEVAVIYDQESIYVGAKCFDHQDSLSKVLSA